MTARFARLRQGTGELASLACQGIGALRDVKGQVARFASMKRLLRVKHVPENRRSPRPPGPLHKQRGPGGRATRCIQGLRRSRAPFYSRSMAVAVHRRRSMGYAERARNLTGRASEAQRSDRRCPSHLVARTKSSAIPYASAGTRYTVLSRQTAYKIRASRRANATTAMRTPRRAAS